MDNLFLLTDYKVSRLSIGQLEHLYIKAQEQMGIEEFNDWSERFWDTVNRVRSGANRQNMSSVVEHLEQYKRSLGRKYSKTKSPFIKRKYNEVEDDIRWLVQQYEVIRSTKPYKL